MSIFSSKKPKISIVFDIGSGSVGVAAVMLFPRSKPKIIFSAREEMAFQENLKFDRFVSSMLDTLEKTARTLERVSFPPHAEKTFSVFFASPWYASQTRVFKKTFSQPTIITDKLLREIQEKETDDFRRFEMEKLGKDAGIVETENVQVKLNGYETSAPEGKTASELEASVYISIIPQKIAKAVREKVSGMFHCKNVSFHTFSFSSFVIVRDIFFHQKSFLFLDISGEVTDISLVRDNVLLETGTFPKGKNFLLRAVASALGSSNAEAVSYFGMAHSEKLEKSEEEKIKNIITKASREWLSDLTASLRELSHGNDFLPRDLFFTADADVSAWFAENIEDEKSEKNNKPPELTVAGTTFFVHRMDENFLSSFCENAPGVARDSFLMLEAIFLAKLTE